MIANAAKENVADVDKQRKRPRKSGDIRFEMCGKGALGDDEVVLIDGNGDEHIFFFETFYNGYDTRRLRSEFIGPTGPQ